MAANRFDVIVIGGGPAGVTAALRARELGASVALVEAGRLGGTCTNDGCVPTRVIAKAARLLRDTRQFADYGLEGEPPRLNFARLMANVQSTVYQMHEKKQLIHHLRTSGAEIFAESGPASFVDPHTITLGDGRRLEGDKFILCAGGRSRRLAFPGADLALTHADLWSLQSLPASVAIVGGAATGCQLASILSIFGARVHILELSPRLLRIEDEAVSSVIMDSFTRQGIDVITSIQGVEKLERGGAAGLTLTYGKDGQPRHLDVAAVILSSGWLGYLDPLNLPAAGVASERNYVVVDDYLRSSAEHIFAAGDINGKMMLVQSGAVEGRIAAENAVLGVGQPVDHSLVPHGGFTDPEYGSVGLAEYQAREAGLDYTVATVSYQDLDRAVIDNHTTGLCKLIVSTETHRILGAHIVGEQALESIHLVAGAMAAQMWVEQLADLQIAYPTFTAIVGLAARRIVHKLGAMPMAAEWVSLDRPSAEWEHSSL